jgi:methylphosphotriester-DNA--protein-cysteine methyltransferase
LRRLNNLKQEQNLVSKACRIIRQAKGSITVEEVCDSLYVTKRRLQRNFKELFGASPKTYQRIVRFRHAYQYARCMASNAIKWTDVSYEQDMQTRPTSSGSSGSLPVYRLLCLRQTENIFSRPWRPAGLITIIKRFQSTEFLNQ